LSRGRVVEIKMQQSKEVSGGYSRKFQ